ncbi:tRNA (guanosine(46)-N7)-methyltransferase TrmB [Cryptosporangium phraense]|uniref:tRNA (guanine-N(7)-)-methyltransferase n=1 Tax=Cryptosporangium phraense TaxID=2593070 RepID=A0A545AXW3_9ACTN|nr:tRNA (guanosine(46)-N7)-methyltransferase TrmB [Cryptosporangium phraense]TQS46172.1 tRNA (guanosine(46)-N7)-methyltransferase TrmB [Cryptosporangium phraense]
MTEPLTRTYKLRSGRITPGQQRALDSFADRFAIPPGDVLLDLPALFQREAPVVLEIGFGMGGTTLEMARADPSTCIIAADVHVPGVGALLRGLHEQDLDNVRVLHGDGAELLARRIPPASLAGIRLYFPDPWPKARHVKRRLVDARFAALAASKLAPGGRLHCATDWAPYAAQMVEVLDAEPGLVLEYGGPVERPEWRPVTKYEARGRAKGHEVADIFAVRNG